MALLENNTSYVPHISVTIASVVEYVEMNSLTVFEDSKISELSGTFFSV